MSISEAVSVNGPAVETTDAASVRENETCPLPNVQPALRTHAKLPLLSTEN